MATHVLVPMDQSAPAKRALEFALTEYDDDDARVTVLHVTNPVENTYFGSEEDLYTQYDILEEESTRRAEEILETAREIAAEHGASIETKSAIGEPSTAIVEFVTDEDVSHVVVGSHGRSGVARIVLGSVAETVVRRAPVPVTVVKAEPEE